MQRTVTLYSSYKKGSVDYDRTRTFQLSGGSLPEHHRRQIQSQHPLASDWPAPAFQRAQTLFAAGATIDADPAAARAGKGQHPPPLGLPGRSAPHRVQPHRLWPHFDPHHRGHVRLG